VSAIQASGNESNNYQYGKQGNLNEKRFRDNQPSIHPGTIGNWSRGRYDIIVFSNPTVSISEIITLNASVCPARSRDINPPVVDGRQIQQEGLSTGSSII
jgi:hypothetical protein